MADNNIIRKLALPENQWKSILTGLGLSVLGAATTYFSQNITNIDFGENSYWIIPLSITVLNIIRKVVLHEPDKIISLSHDENASIDPFE